MHGPTFQHRKEGQSFVKAIDLIFHMNLVSSYLFCAFKGSAKICSACTHVHAMEDWKSQVILRLCFISTCQGVWHQFGQLSVSHAAAMLS